MRIRKIAPLLIASMALAAMSTGGATLLNCTAEDSTNCYWNAALNGNGAGNSFIDVYGLTVYLP